MSESITTGAELTAISLFSGAGIGDVGFRAAGFDFVLLCELESDRAALAQLNFPNAQVMTADVRSARDGIVETTRRLLASRSQELSLLSCTAPCQGMSKNGQGTLLKKIRSGLRPAFDPRNRLILPALDVIEALQPRWVVFENVLEMRNTLIEDHDQQVRQILDVLFDRLGGRYYGQAYDVEFADHGIPQRRQRLITVLTRDPIAIRRFQAGETLIPSPTHAKRPTNGLARWVSVMDSLADFPPLDAANLHDATHPTIPFHRVPVLDSKKYEWIRHVPPGKSAFDNQCVDPSCGYSKNRTHRASRDEDGINRAHRGTPLFCERCGARLPRPFVPCAKAPQGVRLMSGYTSAYKRMEPHLPAPALTRNLSYACSDQKLHPYQNRVLSLAEAMRLHVLDRYAYQWGPLVVSRGKRKRRLALASDSLIRLVIGESVPPLFFELLGRHVRSLMENPSTTGDALSDSLP